jgi:hypothetical protein
MSDKAIHKIRGHAGCLTKLHTKLGGHAECLTKLYTNPQCSLLYVHKEIIFVRLSYLVASKKKKVSELQLNLLYTRLHQNLYSQFHFGPYY